MGRCWAFTRMALKSAVSALAAICTWAMTSGIIFNNSYNSILPFRTTAIDDANIDIGLSSNRFETYTYHP